MAADDDDEDDMTGAAWPPGFSFGEGLEFPGVLFGMVWPYMNVNEVAWLPASMQQRLPAHIVFCKPLL